MNKRLLSLIFIAWSSLFWLSAAPESVDQFVAKAMVDYGPGIFTPYGSICGLLQPVRFPVIERGDNGVPLPRAALTCNQEPLNMVFTHVLLNAQQQPMLYLRKGGSSASLAVYAVNPNVFFPQSSGGQIYKVYFEYILKDFSGRFLSDLNHANMPAALACVHGSGRVVSNSDLSTLCDNCLGINNSLREVTSFIACRPSNFLDGCQLQCLGEFKHIVGEMCHYKLTKKGNSKTLYFSAKGIGFSNTIGVLVPASGVQLQKTNVVFREGLVLDGESVDYSDLITIRGWRGALNFMQYYKQLHYMPVTAPVEPKPVAVSLLRLQSPWAAKVFDGSLKKMVQEDFTYGIFVNGESGPRYMLRRGINRPQAIFMIDATEFDPNFNYYIKYQVTDGSGKAFVPSSACVEQLRLLLGYNSVEQVIRYLDSQLR